MIFLSLWNNRLSPTFKYRPRPHEFGDFWNRISFYPDSCGRIFSPGARGILGDRDDQMGEKNQNPQKYLDQNLTPKKSLAAFPSHKKFPESIKWSNYHESSDCFEYPKKCLPKSSCPKFSYPKKSRNRKFQIQTFWIVAQFLVRKPVNFASLLTAKFLKLWTWMQTRQTQNSFPGPKSYRDFPETGPCMGLHCIKKNR